MGAMSSAEIWGSAEWRGAATAWLDDGLADAGIERTGEVEQPHVRPWATVLRAPTTAGPVWLKATAPGTSAEIGLYALLREVVPEQVLQPIAIDLERSWIVLPDGGPRLDDWLTEVDLAEAMAEIVPAYARLQRALVPHTDRMLALGLADMRPAMLPQRFEEALAVVAPDLERAGEEGRRAYEQLLAAHDTVGSWCGELAGLPGAASVDHSDLHQWNVLIGRPDGMARPRFYDWGDAVVAHAFTSMLVPLWFVQEHVGDISDPRVVRVRDAYLAEFDDLAPRRELVRALELACRTGKIVHTLTWARAVESLAGAEVEAEFAREPYMSVDSLLDDAYLGGD